MRLSVVPGGAVVVTVPRFFGTASLAAVDRFVARSSDWIETQLRKMQGRTVIRIRRGDIPRLKREALVLAEARCAYFASVYGFSHKRITIRAQKTRWGSCSKNGNLSFNYKIAALPIHLQDAIVAHEICHLGAFDHSKRFWDLMGRTIPEHKSVRKELKNLSFVFF
ncbi:MAG: putative metal-dependent hydrolase [Candidatus Kaiserbacteria bacterium]|nr:putative metal-dependent hydrolase [Candidatus Kaiserbacteria bacterium]